MSPPAGISRRCLAILHAVAEVAPDAAGISTAVLQPEALAALVRLLDCSGADSRHQAAALVLLLLERGGRDAARMLAAAGTGPTLVALSGGGGGGEATRVLATQALSGMQALLGPGWQPARPVQHPGLAASLQRAASSGAPAGLPSRAAAQALSLGRATSAPLPAGAPHRAAPSTQPGFAAGSPAGAGGFAAMQHWHGPAHSLDARQGQGSA